MNDNVQRLVPPLNPQRMHLAEQRRNIWYIDVEEGVTAEDLTKPGYWAHRAREMRQGDRIEARCEDGSWYAEFLVEEAGMNFAKVLMLPNSLLTLTPAEPSQNQVFLPGHTIKWSGPYTKFRVVRDADKKVMRENLATRQDAINWLLDYSKTVSQSA